MSANKVIADCLNACVQSVIGYARRELGDEFRHFNVEWSWRMTTLAGKCIVGRTPPLIRLSAPIFLQAIIDLGAERALLELWDTVAHEVAHVHTTEEIIEGDDHGKCWASIAKRLGGSVDITHNLATGADLFPLSKRFAVGDRVRFRTPGGMVVSGVIEKMLLRRARVRAESGQLFRVKWGAMTMTTPQ